MKMKRSSNKETPLVRTCQRSPQLQQQGVRAPKRSRHSLPGVGGMQKLPPPPGKLKKNLELNINQAARIPSKDTESNSCATWNGHQDANPKCAQFTFEKLVSSSQKIQRKHAHHLDSSSLGSAIRLHHMPAGLDNLCVGRK